jgi:hypothetical protein
MALYKTSNDVSSSTNKTTLNYLCRFNDGQFNSAVGSNTLQSADLWLTSFEIKGTKITLFV